MLSKIIVIGWTLFCIAGFVIGARSVDSEMVDTNAAYAVGAGLGMMFWIFIWGIIVVPVALIGLQFKRSR